MEEKIKDLLEKVRSTMLYFENVNLVINGIEDKNWLAVTLKQRLKEYSNTCLADLLIFSDLCYQLVDCDDPDEMELILEAFTQMDEADNEEI